jgi:SAM-dependent methyltransferase
MLKEGKYIGNELELFEKAIQWKSYFAEVIKPFIKGDVLEVGAGIGGTTPYLINDTLDSWLCLEPDEQLAAQIQFKIDNNLLPKFCTVKSIYSSDLIPSTKFDTILYMDVIEHIEADAKELMVAYNHLKSGGSLIILVPAHQFLYTPFDKKIGHFRRYSKKSLLQVIPDPLIKKKLLYLDSIGLVASLMNKVFLKTEMPNKNQIQFWNNYMVPLSRVIDRLHGYSIGKSVLGIWTKS